MDIFMCLHNLRNPLLGLYVATNKIKWLWVQIRAYIS